MRYRVGGGGYRNHAAVTKAEARNVALWFRGWFSHDDLFKVAGKPFQKAAVEFVLGFFFFLIYSLSYRASQLTSGKTMS